MSELSPLARTLEALVFASDEPLDWKRIAAVYGQVAEVDTPDEKSVNEALEELNATYAAHGHGLRVYCWADGLRMSTAEECSPFLEAYFRRAREYRLSRQLMETLAVVSYRQPATKAEVDHVRGVNSDYALRKLIGLGLIDVAGRDAEVLGRPLLYATTDYFLEAFGLRNLKELPNLREIEALLDDPAFSEERAQLLMLKGLTEHST